MAWSKRKVKKKPKEIVLTVSLAKLKARYLKPVEVIQCHG